MNDNSSATRSKGSSRAHIWAVLGVFAAIVLLRVHLSGVPVLDVVDPRNWGDFSFSVSN